MLKYIFSYHYNIVAAAIVGLTIGLVLVHVVDNINDKVDADVLDLPGLFFSRASICVSLLFIFFSISTAIVQLKQHNVLQTVVLQSIGLFAITTTIGVLEGFFWAMIFRGKFHSPVLNLREQSLVNRSTPFFAFMCPDGKFLAPAMTDRGVTYACVASTPNISIPVIDLNNKLFDTTHSSWGNVHAIDLDTLIRQTILSVVPRNIAESSVKGNILGTIWCAVIFGLAVFYTGKKHSTARRSTNSNGDERSVVLKTILQISNVILHLTQILYGWASPFILCIAAVGVITAHDSIYNQLEPNDMSKFYDLLLCLGCAAFAHLTFIGPILYYLGTCKSPARFAYRMIPVNIYACTLSSSFITIPANLDILSSFEGRAMPVNTFVVGLGSRLNLGGTGLYLPIVMIFLAESSGLGDSLFRSIADCLKLILLSVLSTVTPPPLPNAGLVVVVALWQCFSSKVPSTFIIVVAAEALVDRIRTIVNSSDDVVVASIIARYTALNTGAEACGTQSSEEGIERQSSISVLEEAQSPCAILGD